MEIIPFTSKRGCLSYLIVDETSKDAALIDPSNEIASEMYLEAINVRGAHLRYLIETHTHADHISSTPSLAEKTGAEIVRHTKAPSPKKDVEVSGGEKLLLGETALTIIATPGHTNESISIYTDSAVFTGDALLIGGTGRTDFQLGDSEALYSTLHHALGALPDGTTVYPAHDYAGRISTTIGEEKRTNPRFALSPEEFIKKMNAHHPPPPELFEEAISENSK